MKGTGFYAKVNVNDKDVYGIFTNNHVIPSEEMARKAEVTFGFDAEEKGAKTGLRPDKIFKTNKVRFFNIFVVCVTFIVSLAGRYTRDTMIRCSLFRGRD